MKGNTEKSKELKWHDIAFKCLSSCAIYLQLLIFYKLALFCQQQEDFQGVEGTLNKCG